MSKLILLDSGPLGIISNPNKSETSIACQDWATAHYQQGNVIVIPEIAHYEKFGVNCFAPIRSKALSALTL